MGTSTCATSSPRGSLRKSPNATPRHRTLSAMNLIRDARLVTCSSLLTLLVGTSASAQQPPQPVVARLVAEPASVTVQVGDSLPFRVIAFDSAGRVLTNATIRVGGPRRAVFFGDGFVRGFQAGDRKSVVSGERGERGGERGGQGTR